MTENTKQLAVITGAGSGLGREFASQLASPERDLVLIDQDGAGAEKTLEIVRKAGGQGYIRVMDVRDEQAWERLVLDLQKKYTRVNLLINNAGVSGSGEIGVFPLANWRWMMDINFMGYVNGVHAFLPWLRVSHATAGIINVSSMAAVVSAPTMAAYSAAKAAIVSFSETLFAELQGTPIHVTIAVPYFFPTNLLRSGRFTDDRQKSAAMNITSSTGLSAATLARRILRAHKKKRLYVFEPFIEGRGYWLLKRLMPVSLLKLAAIDTYRRLRQAKTLDAEIKCV